MGLKIKGIDNPFATGSLDYARLEEVHWRPQDMMLRAVFVGFPSRLVSKQAGKAGVTVYELEVPPNVYVRFFNGGVTAQKIYTAAKQLTKEEFHSTPVAQRDRLKQVDPRAAGRFAIAEALDDQD